MSSSPIQAVVAIEGGVDREVARAALHGEGGVEIVDIVDGLERATPLLAGPTDLLVVVCSSDSEGALAFIGENVEDHPDRPIVVLCEGSPNGFVHRLFKAGAEDVLLLPAGPEGRPVAPSAAEVLFSLEKAVARRTGSKVDASDSRGSVVAVLGPKGGAGKTVIASSLAVALAESGSRVAAVDIDLQFGDLGLALGLSPERTIYDLATSGGSLDADKLDAYLSTHQSGARVLLAPVRPDQAGVVTTGFLNQVYSVLRASHDHVVVDTPPGFTPEVVSLIDGASEICLVGTLDVLSIKSTKLALETLGLLGWSAERVRVVLNRADSRVGMTVDDVTQVIGRAPDVLVPSHRDITRSVNEAAPLVTARSGSEAARALRRLAASYMAGRAQQSNGRRLLRRRS